MRDVLTAIAGAAIILIVASDIFRSLLLPRKSTKMLRVAPLLTIALFSSWHGIAGRVGSSDLRQAIRASLAPFMLVVTLAVWAALLILGFGMLFWVDRAQFAPSFRTFGDAVYAAGAAFSTLGIDGHVEGGLTRLAVLVCSVAGLAIVTVVATFLISIQTGFGRREALVLRLEAHVTLPPAGIAILETYANEQLIGRLGAFFAAWEQWIAEVAISHRAFPILIFFRSNDSRCEWLAALGAVLDAAALLDTQVMDPPAEARAGAHFVLRTGTRMLTDMADQFGLDTRAADITGLDRLDALRERLAAAGYRPSKDADAALARLRERRDSYAPALLALASRLRIEIDERLAADPARGPQQQPGGRRKGAHPDALPTSASS